MVAVAVAVAVVVVDSLGRSLWLFGCLVVWLVGSLGSLGWWELVRLGGSGARLTAWFVRYVLLHLGWLDG